MTTIPVERLDPRFEALIPLDMSLEVVADFEEREGPHWLEGPAWDRQRGYLLFSDVKANAIWRWQRDGGVQVYMQPSGYTGDRPFAGQEPGSNGLAFDSQGRLLICEHGDRRIRRLEADGSKMVLADRYQGRRLNSPNDLVCRSNGDIYFTDPPFGLPRQFDDPGRELSFSGVYRLSASGELTLLLDELRAPNGIGFSPGEKTLYPVCPAASPRART
jgi:gluconolactonase